MISKETARAAIEASKLKRDPFGHASPFEFLSPTDQLIVSNWFHSFAVGFCNLNSVVYAVANDKLYMLTKEFQDAEYIKSNNEKIDKLEKKINDGMSLEQATRALLAKGRKL